MTTPQPDSTVRIQHRVLFMDFCWQLSPYLDLFRPDPSLHGPSINPPYELPHNVTHFLSECIFSSTLGESHTSIANLWRELSPDIWATRDDSRKADHLIDYFLKCGSKYGISFRTISPPTLVCLDPQCTARHGGMSVLTEAKTYEAILHTKSFGPLPVFPTSLYCRPCKTRYYHDYYVHDNAQSRTYYGKSQADFLHIADHFFVEVSLCELFSNMMVHGCTSASTCARIYNEAIAVFEGRRLFQFISNRATLLDADNVWDGFYIHSLLLDSHHNQLVLSLPHSNTKHTNRYHNAIMQRNQRFAGPGRDLWNHGCDDCCKRRPHGWIRSVVVDGVTVGHPCCSHHDCKNPLPTTKSRHCVDHANEASICAVVSCTNEVTPGWRTCSNQSCRAMDEYRMLRHKSMFQLRNRLPAQARKTSEARKFISGIGNATGGSGSDDEDGDGDGNGDEDDDVEVQVLESGQLRAANLMADENRVAEVLKQCDGKNAKGNVKRRARFGRRWTHNEELCVASCGVIIGRATFFGSEAPNGVKAFLHHLFPEVESIPSFIWHDNNCKLRKILDEGDPLLQVGMPVDVFHFTKHTPDDDYCARHCNPALFPDLRDGEGWTFNSSAAEQANAWFGGFQAITREMRMDRYNFFLDEMIRRRNLWTIQELKRKKKAVWEISRTALLPKAFSGVPK